VYTRRPHRYWMHGICLTKLGNGLGRQTDTDFSLSLAFVLVQAMLSRIRSSLTSAVRSNSLQRIGRTARPTKRLPLLSTKRFFGSADRYSNFISLFRQSGTDLCIMDLPLHMVFSVFEIVPTFLKFVVYKPPAMFLT
jgi:hypothetical protein